MIREWNGRPPQITRGMLAATVWPLVTIVTATATAGQITFTAASLDALADTTAV